MRILTEPNKQQRRWWWKALMIAFQISILACCLPGSAKAEEPLLMSQSYWVDVSGRADLIEAMAAPFQPDDGLVAKGFTQSVLWLKIEVRGREGADPIALIVTPPFLERIELYDPEAGSAESAAPLVSGRDVTPDDVNHVGLSSGFIIAPSKESRILYLRISSSTTLTASIAVMPLNQAMVANQRLEAILAVYVAFLIGLCLWGIVSWLIRREAIYGFFVLRQFYSLLLFMAFFGLFRFFYPEEFDLSSRRFIYVFILVTVIAVTGYFDLRLLSGFGANRWLRRLLGALLFLPAISVAFLIFGEPGTALRLNAVVINVIMLMTCLLAFSVRDPEREEYGSSALWIIRVGFLLMAFVIIVPVLMHQNIIQTRMPAVNFIFLHALLSASVMVALLTIRARRRDLAAQQALIQVQIAERELREESQRRSEKEKFLSMLTHELRNPLGVIRLVADTKSPGGRTIEKAAQDMAGVIERVEQSEKLDSQPASPDLAPVDLTRFVDDLAAEKPFLGRIQVVRESALSISTDGVILRSILRNMLDNALKYSPADTPVMLTASSVTSWGKSGVKLEVVNRVGEAGAPDPGKLYTKYYRSRRAHHQPGSGLGLFLVANWARTLGASIDYRLLRNEDGAESVSFSLWVPS